MNKTSLFYHYNDCAITFCVITVICLMFTNFLLHMLMLETCLPYNLYSSEFVFLTGNHKGAPPFQFTLKSLLWVLVRLIYRRGEIRGYHIQIAASFSHRTTFVDAIPKKQQNYNCVFAKTSGLLGQFPAIQRIVVKNNGNSAQQ